MAVVSSKQSLLGPFVNSLLALLYPFEWLHTLIPVLPCYLSDILGAPTPFIIGFPVAGSRNFTDAISPETLLFDLDSCSIINNPYKNEELVEFVQLSGTLRASVLTTIEQLRVLALQSFTINAHEDFNKLAQAEFLYLMKTLIKNVNAPLVPVCSLSTSHDLPTRIHSPNTFATRKCIINISATPPMREHLNTILTSSPTNMA